MYYILHTYYLHTNGTQCVEDILKNGKLLQSDDVRPTKNSYTIKSKKFETKLVAQGLLNVCARF